MGRMSVSEQDFEGIGNLLPTTKTEEVNGVKREVPIQYVGEVTQSKEKVSQSSGNGYLELTVRLTHPETNEPMYITDMFSYTKRAMWKLDALVAVCGLDRSKLDTDDFLGRFLICTVFHEERDGRKFNKIKGYLRQAKPEEIQTVQEPGDYAIGDGGTVGQEQMIHDKDPLAGQSVSTPNDDDPF